jgi:hypothetical protein
MHTSLWQVIADTPWWVFVVGVYFCYAAFAASKPRITPFQSTWIIPSIIFVFSLLSLGLTRQITIVHIGFWLSGLLSGGVFGWVQFHLHGIKAIPNENKLFIPGTWRVFPLLAAGLLVGHYLDIRPIEPHMLFEPPLVRWLFFSYGAFAGLFGSRSWCGYRCIKRGPYVTLQSTH